MANFIIYGSNRFLITLYDHIQFSNSLIWQVIVQLWLKIYFFVCVYTYTHSAYVEDSLWELLLSYDVGYRDQTQVFMFGSECLYPLSHLTGQIDF